MSLLRDHEPTVIEDFNGWWARGDDDSCPLDHFSDTNNIAYIESGFRTRDGLDTLYGLAKIKRLYTFNTANGDGFIVLNNVGEFYHVKPSVPSSVKILTVTNADDFSMVNYNERAYITPYKQASTLTDFLYVYLDDGNPARKACGVAPVLADGNMTATNSVTAGNVEAGIHVFGAVYETNTGFLTSVGIVMPTVNADGTHKVDIAAIPVSPNSYVTKVHILASKAIDPTLYTGDTKQYELFFIPGAVVNNGTTTLTVNFYDAELLTSADNLFDLFNQMANGSYLFIYHNRMCLIGQPTDPDIVYISNPGEPEAFNQISGFVTLPHDGLGITVGQEYRDVMYLFKINECVAFSDTGTDPVDWKPTVLDDGVGAAYHGVCLVGERGALNVEYFLVYNYNGIYMFNGTFNVPELSYKIKDYWVGSPNNTPYVGIDRTELAYRMQLYNDPIHQLIYLIIPSRKLIVIGDYANGLDAEKIRWGKWTFDIEPTSITLFDKNNILAIGAAQ